MNLELNKLKDRKVLVVGDIMLDTYYLGNVKRISPEAPVPIVQVSHTYNMLGGAANVANNLLGLGCKPFMVGVVGDDLNGSIIIDKFAELNIETIIQKTQFPTITKTRILGNDQHVLRIDFENDNFSLRKDKEQNIISSVEKIIPNVDIVIISDYNKGFCSKNICKGIIELSKLHNKTIIVDPKGKDWNKYHGATIITPNIKELSDISEVDVKNDDSNIHTISREVISKYDLNSLLVTRSEKGISYIDSKLCLNIPTEAREVFDVSGAGDTVVATLAAALAAEFTIENSIFLANKAAGIVVGKHGTSPILYDDLSKHLMLGSLRNKIISNDKLNGLTKLLEMQNRKIVFTNGCFDILHRGHVTYLEEAKKLGDILIIGVNSDASVKRLKGEGRPINDEIARLSLLSALSCVDYVVLFDEDTPLNLIKIIRPNVLVKGGDYALEDIVGREYADNTVTIPFVDGYSTTKIIESNK